MSLAGKLYGDFVVEGALTDGSETVFLVRHRTDGAASGGVLKTVVLPKSDSSQPGVLAARRLDVIALQDRIASDWPEVAPVLDRPTTREQLKDVLTAGEAWFVIPRYETSLQSLLRGLNGSPLSATEISLICRTVARGALALTQVDPGTGRRSHGNLKLSNILIRGLPLREGGSEIVVSDPAPGGRTDQTPAERAQLQRDFEKNDLEALGRILFQLAAGRSLPESTDWNRVWEEPEGEPKHWKKVFGAGGKNWRDLCRDLLHVQTSAGSLSLTAVERRLAEMRPNEPVLDLRKLSLAAGSVAALALILFLIFRPSKLAQLGVEVSLSSADVFLFQTNEPGQKVKLVRGAGSGDQPGRFSARPKAGSYQITIVPTGDFSRLTPVLTNVTLSARESRTLAINIPYATVQLSSIPEGSKVLWHSVNREETLGQTRLTVILPPDARYEESYFEFLPMATPNRRCTLSSRPEPI